MAGVDLSIYQNQQKPDPFAGIGSALDIANSFTKNQGLNVDLQRSQLGLQGDQGVAATYRDPSILNTDGTINAARVNNLLVDNGAGVDAPSAMATNTSIAGGQIGNATNNSAMLQTQKSQALAAANAAAANPGATRSDILAPLTSALHSGQLGKAAYIDIVSGMPPDTAGAIKYVRTRTAGMTPAPEQTSPATAGYNSSLAPVTKTAADVAAAARTPGGTVITPPPGAIDVAASDKKTLFEDQLKAGATMGNVRPLQQALPLIEALNNTNFGPGSAEFAKIKGGLATAGLIDPNASDLQVREQLKKKLLQYAGGAQSAGRSDQALSTALGSNPNLDLTQPANLALVKNQIAMDSMDAAQSKMFNLDKDQNQTYSDFKSGYYQKYDPRAFKLGIMTPQERSVLYKGLGKPGSAAFNKFAHTYDIAKQAGAIAAPGAE